MSLLILGDLLGFRRPRSQSIANLSSAADPVRRGGFAAGLRNTDDSSMDPICQTRAGESGNWFGIDPNEAKALATALAISPPTGMIAPSPAPLPRAGCWVTGDSRGRSP